MHKRFFFRSAATFTWLAAVLASLASASPRAVLLNGNDNSLSTLDLTTGRAGLNTLNLHGFPGSGTASGGRLYVVLPGAGRIIVLDAFTLSPLDTLHTGAGTNPYAAVADAAGNVFASLFLTDEIVKFDPAGEVIGRAPVGRAPEGLLLAGGKLFVAESGIDFIDFGYDPGRVSVLDAASLALEKSIPVGLNPQWLHEVGDEVHVVCTGDYFSVFGEVHILSASALAPVDTVVLGGSPGFLEISDGVGYTSDYFAGIMSYRVATREVLHSAADPITFGRGGYSGMRSDASGHLYVTLYGDDLLVRLRESDGAPETAFLTGDGPLAVLLLPNGPVPVGLLAFSAEPTPTGVALSWSVTDVADLSRFTIARSTGGRWTDLAEFPIAGLVSSAAGWSGRYVDSEAPDGDLHYRLGLVRRDGSIEELGTRLVRREPAMRPPFAVRPAANPVRDRLSLRVSGGGKNPVAATLLSAAGRIVTEARIEAGAAWFEWDLRGIPPGVYFVRATDGAQTSVSRVVRLP